MASTLPNIRFVRCPKCHGLIPEHSNIPVYQCGGCGTILRAKYHIATSENATSELLRNSLQNPPVGNTTSDLISGTEQAGPPICPYQPNSATLHNEMGENSDHSKHSTEAKASDNGSSTPTSPPDTSSNENEMNLRISPQVHDSVRTSDTIEDSAKPISTIANDTEDAVNRESTNLPIICSKSSTRSSHGCIATASSADDGSTAHVPQKFLQLSKRTFRAKKASNKEREDLQKAGASTETGSQFEAQNFPSSNGAELPTRCGIQAPVRETSIQSEDFHSVRNWMESEQDASSTSPSRDSVIREELTDAPSTSTSRDSFINEQSADVLKDSPSDKLSDVKPNQMKILKMVDELRDELSELFDQPVEKKTISTTTPGAYLPRQPVQQPFQSPRAPFMLNPQPSSLCCHPGDKQPSIVQSQSNCANVPSRSDNPPKPVSPVHNREPDKLSKPRRQVLKRHCLPISRGAPFVICHSCLRLLQLPADFLIHRRRLHKLQCGACFEILMYSFRERTNKTPVPVQHPAREADSNGDATIGDELSSLHPNDYHQGDPFSFLEEYGLSYAISDSTDPEPVLHVSRNSSNQTEVDNGRIEETPRLHRLLGYSSASELLFQVGADDEHQSTGTNTPKFYKPFEGSYMGSGVTVTGVRSTADEHSVATSSRIRRGAPPLSGLLKKGIRELNQGLENMKQKVQSNWN